jgi:hypothetical protein
MSNCFMESEGIKKAVKYFLEIKTIRKKTYRRS